MTLTTRSEKPTNTPVYIAMTGLLLQLLCIVFAGGKIVARLEALSETQRTTQALLQGNITVTQQLITRVTVLEERLNHATGK